MRNSNRHSAKKALIHLSLIAAIGGTSMVAWSQGASPDATPGLSPNATSDIGTGGTNPPDTAPGGRSSRTINPSSPAANSYNSQPDVTTTADTAGATPKSHTRTHHTKRVKGHKHASDSTNTASDSSTGGTTPVETMPGGTSK